MNNLSHTKIDHFSNQTLQTGSRGSPHFSFLLKETKLYNIDCGLPVPDLFTWNSGKNNKYNTVYKSIILLLHSTPWNTIHTPSSALNVNHCCLCCHLLSSRVKICNYNPSFTYNHYHTKCHHLVCWENNGCFFVPW